MVKHHVANSVFSYSWNQVACAFWNRYPNPFSNHVLTEDIVSKEIVNGKLVVKKLITKTNKIPKWGEKFLLGKCPSGVHMIEESIVDPIQKTLVTYIRNIGMTSILLVGEKTSFSATNNDKNITLCQRIGWTESQLRIIGTSRPIEAFVMDRFKKNIKSTTKGFDYTLEKLFPTTADELITTSATTASQLKERAKEVKERAKKATTEIATHAGHKVVYAARKTAA